MFRIVVIVLTLGACSDYGISEPTPEPPDPPQEATLSLELVADGLSGPVHLTAPAGDDRLFIVEQPGRVLIVSDGELLPEPFLDIRERVGSGGERGLLSLAFHPDYQANGSFFVYFTDLQGDSRVERFQVSGDANVADAASSSLVLGVEQPFSNHNGGLLTFGPDGMLFVGLGDGGSGGDPLGHGQNRGTLLGSILRLDVDGGDPYAIPPDNPFASGGGLPEIWAYGLRNPWRYSFDRTSGELYVADVGQNQWEEVNAQPSSQGGVNYG